MDIVVASKPYYTAPSNLAPNPSIGLFAASSLQPGNQILSIPQSLLAIPDNEHLNETCAHCFAWKPAVDVGSSVQGLLDGNKRLRFCKKCRTVKYCSTVGMEYFPVLECISSSSKPSIPMNSQSLNFRVQTYQLSLRVTLICFQHRFMPTQKAHFQHTSLVGVFSSLLYPLQAPLSHATSF